MPWQVLRTNDACEKLFAFWRTKKEKRKLLYEGDPSTAGAAVTSHVRRTVLLYCCKYRYVSSSQYFGFYRYCITFMNRRQCIQVRDTPPAQIATLQSARVPPPFSNSDIPPSLFLNANEHCSAAARTRQNRSHRLKLLKYREEVKQ